ncbi:MAG: hypothetical protein QME75_14685 [Deltaproteobacteria bacterium]|nr:hypothetical protein [Desulfitobacteriaceae bacterium]MDI6854836.1 hypothetical protein [Deltaproteobacteria bacterium]
MLSFPIVFMISTTWFTLLYLLTNNLSFETTAWHCLWGGVLFTPAAMLTGLFTWWINYEADWLRQVIIKMVLSPILFLLSLTALIWRYHYPGVLTSRGPASAAYFVLVLALAPLVIAIGWYGASLSFPLEEE